MKTEVDLPIPRSKRSEEPLFPVPAKPMTDIVMTKTVKINLLILSVVYFVPFLRSKVLRVVLEGEFVDIKYRALSSGEIVTEVA